MHTPTISHTTQKTKKNVVPATRIWRNNHGRTCRLKSVHKPMSWSDQNISMINSDSCIIKEYPQPPFKIECANAQLEQPIATVGIQFNIGAYTFTAFLKYSQILWKTTLLTLVLTDNRSVTRFFQTKVIPPTLWKASNY